MAVVARKCCERGMTDIEVARREGLRCLMIELRETEIDALIRIGLLNAEMRNDASAVSEALYVHLDRTLGSTQ